MHGCSDTQPIRAKDPLRSAALGCKCTRRWLRSVNRTGSWSPHTQINQSSIQNKQFSSVLRSEFFVSLVSCMCFYSCLQMKRFLGNSSCFCTNSDKQIGPNEAVSNSSFSANQEHMVDTCTRAHTHTDNAWSLKNTDSQTSCHAHTHTAHWDRHLQNISFTANYLSASFILNFPLLLSAAPHTSFTFCSISFFMSGLFLLTALTQVPQLKIKPPFVTRIHHIHTHT